MDARSGQDGSADPPARFTDWATKAVDAVRRATAAPEAYFVLGVLLAVGALIEVNIYVAVGIGTEGDTTAALLANVLATAPLAFAARYVIPAAAVITLASMVIAADPTAMFTLCGLAAQLLVLYIIAVRGRPWVSGLFTLPFLVNAITPFSGGNNGPALALVVLVVATQLLGISHRQRGQAIAERDATREAMALTLREQAAMGERARIARELHDVVAHHLSVIAVQAETGRLATAGLPEQGRERFEAIGDTARNALTEMRRLLGVLRDDAGGETGRDPQPGLDRLSELVDAARAAGSDVRLTLRGRVVALSPGIDLTAYRIVQEALTNARRHAPGAAVDVEVNYGTDLLRLRVLDNGPGPTGVPVASHGLLGMQERAAVVGGALRVGPGATGGFAVEADLPLREAIS